MDNETVETTAAVDPYEAAQAAAWALGRSIADEGRAIMAERRCYVTAIAESSADFMVRGLGLYEAGAAVLAENCARIEEAGDEPARLEVEPAILWKSEARELLLAAVAPWIMCTVFAPSYYGADPERFRRAFADYARHRGGLDLPRATDDLDAWGRFLAGVEGVNYTHGSRRAAVYLAHTSSIRDAARAQGRAEAVAAMLAELSIRLMSAT